MATYYHHGNSGHHSQQGGHHASGTQSPHNGHAAAVNYNIPHGAHNNRSRRMPRLGGNSSQHAAKQFRGVRSPRDMLESPLLAKARARFEAGRSFDLDDDLEFCPGLLTEDDMHSMHSSSDGSLSSDSPESSPLQPQIHPVPHATSTYPLSSSGGTALKIHQPAALRTRNAIPIVNPSTGMRLPSPPTSVSPALVAAAQQGSQSSQSGSAADGLARRW